MSCIIAIIREIDMSIVTILFYLVFLSQILLISYYYQTKLRNRILYVLTNYPPAKYPKLYPRPYDCFAEEAGKKGLRTFRNINLFIAAVGLAMLVAAIRSGYSPSLKGGDEIFVLMYFMLQMSPFIYAEIRGFKQYKRMREVYVDRSRKADLNPRHLFDFISPAYIALAVLMYAASITYFLYNIGFDAPWEGEVYVTLVGVTGMNLLFVAMIAKNMYGKKIDPHQSSKDRLKRIEIVVKTTVFTSIGVSVFFMLTGLADEFELEVYDPVLTSIYVQLIALFGLGLEFRTARIETIDFDVYKENDPVTPA